MPQPAEKFCDYQFGKKYQTRPGPPFPANDPGCRGLIKKGNDGFMYESVLNKRKIYTWKLIKESQEQLSPKKQLSPQKQSSPKKQSTPKKQSSPKKQSKKVIKQSKKSQKSLRGQGHQGLNASQVNIVKNLLSDLDFYLEKMNVKQYHEVSGPLTKTMRSIEKLQHGSRIVDVY